jgi:hypothetical protein
MALSMKERYARLDISKLPKNYADEFEEMSKQTYGFSDEDLNDIFSENFSDMYSLVEKKYPDAIKKGGEIKKVKPSKVKTVSPKRGELPKIDYKGEEYFIDFKLREIRSVKSAEPIKFTELTDEKIKSEIRKIRASVSTSVYMEGLDDSREIKSRKLSRKDIYDIEGTIVEANENKTSDKVLTAELVSGFAISTQQAEKWVKKRDKYLSGTAYGDYEDRTEKKKKERYESGKNSVKTRDGYIFDKKSPENKGLKFFDENGKEWTCKGYNVKLDECIMEDKEGKQISSCLKDMYVYNPVEDRERGTEVRDCKETLKKAGYTVKEHTAGSKKIKRSEPRPERDIIKERVESTFKPILKDISGSEEKDKKYKETISTLENVKALFTKLFNRLNNLAEDNNAEDIKKIEKLLKDLVG